MPVSMQHSWLVPLLGAVGNTIILVLVLRGGARSASQRAFAWMTFTTVTWSLDLFALYYFTDPAAAEWWSTFFRTGMCFLPAAFFHATLALSESWGRRWIALLGVAYAVGGLLGIANLHGDLVSGVSPHVWGWYIRPKPLYSAMTALILIYTSLSLERVWHAYRHPTSPRQRVQAKFWFLAALVQPPFILTSLLTVYGINIYPLGSIGNLIGMSVIAYAIARHRLMDVDSVVRKGVSFMLAAALVLAPGGLAMWALCRSMEVSEPAVLVSAAMSLALIAVVLVPAVQAGLETRIQRAFFAERYDYRHRLQELAAALVHVLDRHALVTQLGEGLSEVLDLEDCQVFLAEEESRRLVGAYPAAIAGAPMPDGLAQVAEAVAYPILTSELEDAGHPAATRLRREGWELFVPLRLNERLTGFIALGRNREFRIFSGEDLQLLTAVAAGASAAFENVSLSRQLRRSEVFLERANRLSSLGLLAAGIAHEIRNPLVAVKTFLDLIPQRLDDHEFLSQFRELSLGELRRVTDLIADLLALGKSKTAERRAVEIMSTLEPVVRLMESTARKRQVEVTASFAPGLPSVWADPDQLKQIVLNLILNAIESSAPGAHVRVEVRPGTADGVVLEVRDEGAGIAPEQLETIFHPFFTTKETGTGLGLTLVHQMIVEHGGEITVESVLGRGTVFRVTLPGARLALAATGT